jgi:Flp pilus assembly protein TadD
MDRLAAANAGEKGHAARATRALEAGQPAVAAEEFGKALAAEPADADAWANLGVARERLGDAAAAAEAYRKAIALAPEAPRPRYNLGTLLARRAEAQAGAERARTLAEGVEQLAAAVRLAPDWKDARVNLATAEEARGDAAAALTQYDEILKRDPADASARYRRGLALLALGRASDAAAELAKLVAAEPAAPEPRAALATALLRAGREGEARAALEAGLERTPERLDLAAQLVRVLACAEAPAVRNGNQALVLAERLLAAGDTPEREALAAMALAELGRFSDAVARQRRAIESAGGAPPATLDRLRAHLALYESGKPCRAPWKG